jgi:hypothetical protein
MPLDPVTGHAGNLIFDIFGSCCRRVRAGALGQGKVLREFAQPIPFHEGLSMNCIGRIDQQLIVGLVREEFVAKSYRLGRGNLHLRAVRMRRFAVLPNTPLNRVKVDLGAQVRPLRRHALRGSGCKAQLKSDANGPVEAPKRYPKLYARHLRLRGPQRRGGNPSRARRSEKPPSISAQRPKGGARSGNW